MAERGVPATLDEMRAIVAQLPGPDQDAAQEVVSREAQLAKPAGALGRLEEIVQWMATWQGKHPPSCNHPRTAVFAANHGVAARGGSYPEDVTAQMVKSVIDDGAAVNQLCRAVDADLRVYEMALEEPTADFTQGPAMSEEECAMALAYGMMAVEPGIDLLAVGDMAVGNTLSAAAVAMALYGGDAAQWADADGAVVVDQGVARHKPAAKDGFDLLRRLGGRELAATVGAIIAARMAHMPVLIDGYAATAAAACLAALDAHAIDHCLIAHVSAEPGHRRLLDKLGKKPLLDLGIRDGEAAGATLAIALVKAALDCHTGMAISADAGMSRTH